MIIAFPEFDHPKIQSALDLYASAAAENTFLPPVEAVSAPDLATACDLINRDAADAIICGIAYSSRDVILTCRDAFPMTSFTASIADPDDILGMLLSDAPYRTFSGLVVMQRGDEIYILSDVAACKSPTRDQLIEIIQQAYTVARIILPDDPRIALLSYSSFGSGGKSDQINLLRSVLDEFSGSEIIIDGEMQLDTALNPEIAAAKFPDSPVAGRANVLIAPDLNSGNLLYKSFEQVAGFTIAGPLLQGFDAFVSDLSRGSTPEDVAFTIEILAQISSAYPPLDLK